MNNDEEMTAIIAYVTLIVQSGDPKTPLGMIQAFCWGYYYANTAVLPHAIDLIDAFHVWYLDILGN